MEQDEKQSSGTSLTEGASVSVSASESATARHTPGPWRVASSSSYPLSVDGRLNIDAEQRGYVCLAGDHGDAEAVANAHLIAAAPEMYEALKGMLDQPETPESYDAMVARVQAALAKAEGR